MMVPITVFLGMFFPIVSLFVVFIILGFLVRLIAFPMRLFWNAILNLT